MACPYLCGGVFFLLLAQATYKKNSSRKRRNGIKETHSNEAVTADLLTALSNGSEYRSAKKDFSSYRNCKSEGSINIPFNDVSFASSYDESVRNNYTNVLARMSEFTELHIDKNKIVWFVKALLDIIENDADILDSDLFYIQENGLPVSKSEIKAMTVFSFQAFLIGVVHFFLMNRRGKNQLGIQTLDAWSTAKPNGRTYHGNAGATITRNIMVSYWRPSTINPADSITSIADDNNSCDGVSGKNTAEAIAFPKELLSDASPYSLRDQHLLREFTTDYDEIMLTLIGENYAASFIDMTLPCRIQNLYESKWREKADAFLDPSLKSYAFGLLGELNLLSKTAQGDCSDWRSMRSARTKIRNLYVKLHPNLFAGAFPYDAFIDDWNDGEF